MKLDLNIDKIRDYEKELVKYDGYIPSILRWLISIDYMKNITKSENAVEISKKMAESKYYDFEQLHNELVDWCNENPKYKDILVN